MIGGLGNDVFEGKEGNDTIDAGDGHDSNPRRYRQ